MSVGLVEVEELEDGGGDVAEAAAWAEGGGALPLCSVMRRKGTGLVVWAVWGPPVSGVDEHLGVAVVGGDEEAAAALADGLIDAAELAVDGFDGADGGFHLAGVADHVGVGEVDDDDVEGGVVRRL